MLKKTMNRLISETTNENKTIPTRLDRIISKSEINYRKI